MFELSGLEDILSSVLDRRRIEPGDPLRMELTALLAKAAGEMNLVT